MVWLFVNCFADNRAERLAYRIGIPVTILVFEDAILILFHLGTQQQRTDDSPKLDGVFRVWADMVG